MGLNRRPKTGRKFDGSKLIVDNNAIKTVQFEAQRIPEFIFEDPGPALSQRPTPTNTPTNSATPLSPTPQETPTNTPTLSRTPRVTPTPTKSIRATPTPTRTPKSSSTPTKSIQASPTPTKSVQSTPDKTPTPTATPRQTKSPTVSPSQTSTPPKSKTPTPTRTPSPTPSPTQTESNLPTPTNTRTNTPSPTRTKTPAATPSFTPTSSPTPTVEPTQSVTATETPTTTPSVTPTKSINATPSVTRTETITPSPTRTPRQTNSPTRTPVATRTPRGSESATPTNTPTPTLTPTFTPSNTLTPTVTRTPNPCSCYSITNNTDSESVIFFYRNCSGENANGTLGPPTDTFLGVAYVCGNDVVADSIATVALIGPCGVGNSCPSGPAPSRTATRTPTITNSQTSTPRASQSPTVTLSITNSVSASPPCERPSGLDGNVIYLISGWFAGSNYTGTFTPIQNLTLQAACNQWLNYSADEDSSAQAIILLYSSFSVDGYLYPPYSQASNTCDCGIANGTYWINYAFPGLAPSKSDPISLIVVTNCVIRLIADCDNLPAESPTPTVTSTVTPTPTVTVTLTPGFSPTPAASSTPEVSPTVTKTPNCVPPVGLYPYTWVFAWSDGVNNYDFQNTSVNNACNEFVNYLAETSPTFISTVSFFSLSNDTVVVGATIYGREDSCDCPPELNGYFWVNDDNIRKPAGSLTTSLSIVYVEDCVIRSITPCYPLVSPGPTPSFTVTPTVTPTTPGNCDCVTLVLFDINTNEEITFTLTPDLSNPSTLGDGTITYIYSNEKGTVYTFFKENNGWLLYYNSTLIYLGTPDISDCPSSVTDWQLLNDIKIRFVSISAGPCGDPTPTPTETSTPTPTPECDKTGFNTTIYIAYQLWDGTPPGPPNAPFNFQSLLVSMGGACSYYRPDAGVPLGGINWASHPDWSIYTNITAKVSGYTGGGGAALLGLIITGSDDTICGCGYINQGQFWVNRIDPTVPPTIDSGVVVVRFDKLTCEITQVLDCGAGAPVSPAPTSTPAVTPSPAPFDFTVGFSCNCPNEVVVSLFTPTGGALPYQIYVGVFNSQAAALANTNWSFATSFGTNIGSCGITNGNTYWFVAKDANNTIITKSVTIVCTSFAACDPWLLAGGGRNVYIYNRASNTVTQLTQFNINTSRDIAHTNTRVWFSQATTIQQFDYTLNPFSVGTLTTLTSPDILGNGLAVFGNNTLFGTRKNGAIDEIIRINLPVGASTTTTNQFFANSGMIDIKDLSVTNDGFLIATGFGTSTSDPVVKEWNISTANPNPVVSVNLTPTTFSPVGHYDNSGTLFVVNLSTSESWKQFQDFSWSITNTNIFIPLTNIAGISQLSTCFLPKLNPQATPLTMRVRSIAGTTMEINLETTGSGVSGWDSVTMGVNWGDGGTTNSYSANNGQQLLDTLTNTPQNQTFSITHPYNLEVNADIVFTVVGTTQPPPLPFYSLSFKRISYIGSGSVNFRDMFSSTDGSQGLLQMWFILCSFQNLDIDAPRKLQQINIVNHQSSILNIGFIDGLLGNFDTIRQIRFISSPTVTSLNQDFRGTLLDWVSGDANIFALDLRLYSVCTTVTFKLPLTITRLGFTDMASLATINLSTVSSSGINGLIGTVLTYIQVREVLQLTSWTYLLPNTMVTFTFVLNRSSNTTGGVSSFTINLANNTTNLQTLRMDGNRMSTFNPINLSSCNGLLTLNLYDNLLTAIPTLPSNLTTLNISGNRLTTRPTSLPSSLVTLFMGGSPNLSLSNPNVANSNTNNNNFGSQFSSVTDTYFSSMSNLTSLKMRNLGLTAFNSPVPSNTLNFLDISSGGPEADANNIPIIRFQSFPNVRDLYAFKIGATTLSGISSTTRLEYLLVGENAFTNQNDFFQPNPGTTFFPSTLKTLLMYNNNIVNWSKNLFGPTGVLSIESVNMQGCSFNATSINYILNYFASLKSAGRVPNLTQINLSDLQGSPTPNPNSPPDTTSGGINGCTAKNTLTNATPPTVTVLIVSGGPCP